MQSITAQTGSVVGHQTQKKKRSILYTLSGDLLVIAASRSFCLCFHLFAILGMRTRTAGAVHLHHVVLYDQPAINTRDASN
jgi:hypothetical protein